MKPQPESAEPNSDRQNDSKPKQSLHFDPLANLYELLGDIIEEDQTSKTITPELDSSELSQLPPQIDSTVNFVEPVAPLVEESNSQPESVPNNSSQESYPIEEEISDSLEQQKAKNSPQPRNYQKSLAAEETTSTAQIRFDSLDREKIAKAYISQQWIAEKERQIHELADSVNSLIPLIVELSKTQADNSQEYILNAVTPIIDRVIQQRSLEDRQKMASAIAAILPHAIEEEINHAPESIGKAIAPEIALSIKEQIKLSEGAIAQALGSEMGKAIKTQIEMERDAMVDALYPVIGSTISKYMAEVVQSINEKVDAALSPQGIKRKIRAKLQGVSEAELILKESFPYHIRAIFLIHKNSGLIIREIQPDIESSLESDLLAGMLTAIRSFANDCIASDSEIDEIDYDKFQILFETAGYCYLAVVVNGEPNRQFRDRMRTIFSQIIMKYGNEIERYQGNPATIPESIQPLLEELLVQEIEDKTHKSPKTLYWLIALLLGAILIPWGISKYRRVFAYRIEKAVAIELDATPELSVYRLIPEVKKGQLLLTGRVPSSYLKNLAATVTNPIAQEKNLQLNNQIVAVDVPVDPTVTAQEIARTTQLLNQKSQVLINSNYQDRTVIIDGLILDPTTQQNLIKTFNQIPGVENVVFIIKQELPQLNTRFYFASGSSNLALTANQSKIREIKQFLNQYPLIKLKIIGHSDREGSTETNFLLAQARANLIYQILVSQGISPQRLQVIASTNTPPNISSDQPLELSRCVRFESFIAEKNLNK